MSCGCANESDERDPYEGSIPMRDAEVGGYRPNGTRGTEPAPLFDEYYGIASRDDARDPQTVSGSNPAYGFTDPPIRGSRGVDPDPSPTVSGGSSKMVVLIAIAVVAYLVLAK